MSDAPATLDRFITLDGVRVPTFLYGTAWKEERTEPLARLAIDAGFGGIDTANQRRHYHEAGVGRAVAGADRIFLQTKFTHLAGQDHRLPYDPQAPIGVQVRQSFESSLEHLGRSAVDSYVLHGPSARGVLIEEDWEVWRAMEGLHGEGRVKLLGASNVDLPQVKALCDGARVKPRFVQNRCFAADRWDGAVRAFCRRRGIVYQGFSLLTANLRELQSPAMAELVQKRQRAIPELVFRFAQHAGMIPLTGTKDSAHMKQDLTCYDFTLEPDEIDRIEAVAFGTP